LIARNRQPLARKSRESLPALKSSIVLVAFMALVSGLLDRAIQHALVEMSIDTPSSGSNGRDIDR
jgi:hypothetical protein